MLRDILARREVPGAKIARNPCSFRLIGQKAGQKAFRS
jgi:hypothetical protein